MESEIPPGVAEAIRLIDAGTLTATALVEQCLYQVALWEPHI